MVRKPQHCRECGTKLTPFIMEKKHYNIYTGKKEIDIIVYCKVCDNYFTYNKTVYGDYYLSYLRYTPKTIVQTNWFNAWRYK